MRFIRGRELQVVHPKYGDGLVLETNKVKGTWWYTVKINDHLIVETPKSEWKLKRFDE